MKKKVPEADPIQQENVTTQESNATTNSFQSTIQSLVVHSHMRPSFATSRVSIRTPPPMVDCLMQRKVPFKPPTRTTWPAAVFYEGHKFVNMKDLSKA
ncbi:hypothetical protein Leryth_022447 [Lithospermum erythrorhizon]|nr:hypothetical protein Leryth_022447 [Lithospermum erythrorhizon]